MMPDLEKVICGLVCCSQMGNCLICPYFPDDDSPVALCDLLVMSDALTLLREREPEKSGWISVAERLPKPPCQCLVYSDKACRPRGMETATYTKFGWMTAAYFPEITHWMPLPEPPEERK